MNTSKQCRKCGGHKSPDDFNKNAAKPGGLQPFCKKCQKDAAAIWGPEAAEKERARQAKWAAETRERDKADRARWVVETREAIKAVNAKSNAETCEKPPGA